MPLNYHANKHQQIPTNSKNQTMNQTMTSEDKAVKLSLFDSKKKNFVLYWTQMKAYMRVHKFAQALCENPETELPQTEAVRPGPI
jgi:hypothetical protein